MEKDESEKSSPKQSHILSDKNLELTDSSTPFYVKQKQNSSDFTGIKTSKNKESSDEEKSTDSSNENDEKYKKRVPTLFEWKDGGENVFITGSFCDWNQRFILNKNKYTDNFDLLLYLPQGKYEFKFIVDNNWVCSNYYNKITDEKNNTNNVIDNTHYLIKNYQYQKLNSNKSNSSKNSYDSNYEIKNNSSKTNNIKKDFEQNYGKNYPEYSMFNKTPQIIPNYYKYNMNINFNTNQFKICNSEYIDLNDSKNLINDKYKSITLMPNIFVNHLYMKCEKSNKQNDNNNYSNLLKPDNYDEIYNKQKHKKYAKITTTIRVRRKFATIVYVKPLKN